MPPSEYLTEFSCPCCGSDAVIRASSPVATCAVCGLPRLHPYMSRAGQVAYLQAYYTDGNYHLNPADPVAVGAWRPQWEIDLIRKVEPGLVGGRALDVGSNNGYFVAGLARNGLNATGLEPYRKSVEIGRRFGLDIREGRFEPGSVPSDLLREPFDLLAFRNVICFMTDLDEAFGLMHRMIRSDGLLYISNLLFESPYFLLHSYPGRFSWLASFLPSREWLLRTLETRGFKVERAHFLKHDVLQQFGWPATARGRLMRGINALVRPHINSAVAGGLQALGRVEHAAIVCRRR